MKLRELIGQAIYEGQRNRLQVKTSDAAKRDWRSKDVPSRFWEEFCLDADVVIAVLELEKLAADVLARDEVDESMTVRMSGGQRMKAHMGSPAVSAASPKGLTRQHSFN